MARSDLLELPCVQARRKIGVRPSRGRKITSKRGECEFSECCNRHEWGLIDGSSSTSVVVRAPAWPGRDFTNFHYTRSQRDTGVRKLRERKSVEDAQSRLLERTASRTNSFRHNKLFGKTTGIVRGRLTRK